MICGGGGGGSGFGERDFSAKEMIVCVVTNKEKNVPALAIGMEDVLSCTYIVSFE